MGFFTFKKGHIGASLSAHSSFKSFIVLVVMILMTASSVMAEVIDGIRYNLDSDTKTATLLPKKYGGYSGDINIPEKVKGNDGVAYSVISLGNNCFDGCIDLTSITIPSSVTSLGEDCFKGCSDLETIYFKGKVPKIYGFHAGIPTSSIIKVPAEYLQDYKNAFGSNYQYK